MAVLILYNANIAMSHLFIIYRLLIHKYTTRGQDRLCYHGHCPDWLSENLTLLWLSTLPTPRALTGLHFLFGSLLRYLTLDTKRNDLGFEYYVLLKHIAWAVIFVSIMVRDLLGLLYIKNMSTPQLP